MSVKLCEKCGRVRPGSPFKTPRKTYKHLCGGCKARVTFTPAVKKQFEADIRAALAGVVLGGEGSREKS